jgi:hypothetical protein
MKKTLITAILATSALVANAVEVGITTATDYSAASKATGTGFTVGQKIGTVGVTGGFERFTGQDRYSVTAGYDLYKFGPVTVTPKLGVAYLNNAHTADGSALTFGIGATLPLTKQTSLTVDATRQYGQDSVQGSDGNRVTAGLKYRF